MLRRVFIFSLSLLLGAPALCVEEEELSLEVEGSIGRVYAGQNFDTHTDPDDFSPVRARVPQGFELIIFSESEDHEWYWVQISDGIFAWARKEHVSDIRPAIPAQVDPPMTDEELRRFHFALSLDRIYSFNFEFLAGRYSKENLSGHTVSSYTGFLFGPSIGQSIGQRTAHGNCLVDLRLLLARETYRDPNETVGYSLTSVGLGGNIRYLWVWDRVFATGVYAGLAGLTAIHPEEVHLERPGFLILRAGFSLSGALPQDSGLWVVDVGTMLRSSTIAAAGGVSFIF
jgi:hypothetical protein